MVSLICGQRLKDELSAFYHIIDDNVIERLKDLCIIHDMTEEEICSQVLAFVMKYERKELNLQLINDFQTDYLDKKAINDHKKSLKVNKTNKTFAPNTGFKANESIKALINEFTTDSSVKPKKTTQIEVVNDDSSDETKECCVGTQDYNKETTPERDIEPKLSQDVSSMTTPVPTLNESINTSLKSFDSLNSNTICYFGNSFSDSEWKNRSKTMYSIEHYDKSMALIENYKFMSLKITESNEIMNDLIDELSELLKEKLDIDCWGQFSVVSPSEKYYIGRVCFDWNKSKLSENSVMFEGSRYITNNETIALDLSRLSQYSLFPGQVMACKAFNESGKSLIIQEIIDSEKIIAIPKTVPTFTQPLNIVVGVGPFSKPESIGFESLKKLMEYIQQYEPDFCILIGPFVDSNNDKLLSIDESNERLFNSQMRFISEEIMSVKTEVIVIPSTKDINVFNIFPTMPFSSYTSPKIHFYSNPTVININGVIIGITSSDVLLHLSKEEISAGQNIDRLSRLCKHIISQRSFYPIFPPNPEINLEFTKYDFLRLPITPHILILPSDLKEFVKNISQSVVINSGRLFKNKFARIRIDVIDRNAFNGSLESYTNVEIVKINN